MRRSYSYASLFHPPPLLDLTLDLDFFYSYSIHTLNNIGLQLSSTSPHPPLPDLIYLDLVYLDLVYSYLYSYLVYNLDFNADPSSDHPNLFIILRFSNFSPLPAVFFYLSLSAAPFAILSTTYYSVLSLACAALRLLALLLS